MQRGRSAEELETEVAAARAALSAAEGRIAHLSRVYGLASAIRKEISRIHDEPTLFERACRVAVEQGGFRFAWVGAVDRSSGRIVPVARFGHEEGYLSSIRVDVERTPFGEGPCGCAVREGTPIVVNDVEADLRMSPWKEAALARGYRSSIGFPLRRGGEVTAVLSIYSGQIDSFDDAEVAMLRDLADDIGLALDSMAAAAERERLQTQLLHADRMASMGRLAASVAHEINSPLAYVALNLELVARKVDAGVQLDEAAADVIRRAVADARHGAERVRRIVRSLGAFGRGDETPVGAVDVGRAIDAALDITSVKLRHRATVVRDYRADRPARGNEFRLGQVFVNLLINAADAIGDSTPERETITLRTYVEGARVVAEVIDTGPGMAPDVARRIFDPFFTTKPVGMGTGLGLAVSQNIVASYAGRISVDTEPGRGTTMRVSLPLADFSTPDATRSG